MGPPLWQCCVQGACAVPCFCSQLFRNGSWVLLVFLYLVHNLPQLHMHAGSFFFSPLEFLCILLLEETFVQVQALQQRRPGPRFLPVSPGPFPVCSKPLPTTLGAGVVISSLRNEVDETRPHKIVQDHTASGWQGWGMNLRFLISNSLLVMG